MTKEKEKNKKYTSDAIKILHDRYFKGHPIRKLRLIQCRIETKIEIRLYNFKERLKKWKKKFTK